MFNRTLRLNGRPLLISRDKSLSCHRCDVCRPFRLVHGSDYDYLISIC